MGICASSDLFFKRNGLLYLSLMLERTAERLRCSRFLVISRTSRIPPDWSSYCEEMRSGERDVGTHATPLIAALEQSLSGVLRDRERGLARADGILSRHGQRPAKA